MIELLTMSISTLPEGNTLLVSSVPTVLEGQPFKNLQLEILNQQLVIFLLALMKAFCLFASITLTTKRAGHRCCRIGNMKSSNIMKKRCYLHEEDFLMKTASVQLNWKVNLPGLVDGKQRKWNISIASKNLNISEDLHYQTMSRCSQWG